MARGQADRGDRRQQGGRGEVHLYRLWLAMPVVGEAAFGPVELAMEPAADAFPIVSNDN